MKPLNFNGTHVHPHGSYIEDWYDNEGLIWERVMEIPKTVESKLLEMAYVFQMGPDFYLSDLGVLGSDRRADLHWLQVGNKDFVVYNVDKYGSAFAIYNHDGRLRVIVGEVSRLRARAEKESNQEFNQSNTRLLLLALDTLQYDIHDRDLVSRLVMTEGISRIPAKDESK